MHELSICASLLGQVMRVADEQRARRIISITVRIGPFAGVESELLESAYPIASTGTLAAGSTLIIEHAEVRVLCRECGALSDVQCKRLLCGRCGSWRVQLQSGDELLLVSIELERDNEPESNEIFPDTIGSPAADPR